MVSSIAGVKGRVCEILAEVAEVPVEDISDELRIGTDLGIGGENTIGQAEFLELFDLLEREFGRKIPAEIKRKHQQNPQGLPDIKVREIRRLFETLVDTP